MESFEVTFFCLKKDYNKAILNIVTKLLEKYIVFGERNLVEVFGEKGHNYVEIRISIFGFTLTEEIFKERFTAIALYVGEILKAVNYIFYATGIYEFTYYYIEKINCLSEFNETLFRKFPILFFRPENDYDIGEIIYEDENVICRFNKTAQILY